MGTDQANERKRVKLDNRYVLSNFFWRSVTTTDRTQSKAIVSYPFTRLLWHNSSFVFICWPSLACSVPGIVLSFFRMLENNIHKSNRHVIVFFKHCFESTQTFAPVKFWSYSVAITCYYLLSDFLLSFSSNPVPYKFTWVVCTLISNPVWHTLNTYIQECALQTINERRFHVVKMVVKNKLK